VTFVIEVLGVHTGFPFGAYHYSSDLGFPLFGVPPVIGLNWVLVILGSISLVDSLFHKPLLALGAAPLVCVIFDLVLEPNSFFLRYWTWNDGMAPFQNYLAWGLITFACTGVFLLMRIRLETRLAAVNLVLQFFFFLVLLLYQLLTGALNG
jgi:putative membrane protein